MMHTWTRHDYNVVSKYLPTGTVQRETFSTYNRKHTAERYGSDKAAQERGGIVSTLIGGGVFVSRAEATYYLKSLRDRLRNKHGSTVLTVTCTRTTYNSDKLVGEITLTASNQPTEAVTP